MDAAPPPASALFFKHNTLYNFILCIVVPIRVSPFTATVLFVIICYACSAALLPRRGPHIASHSVCPSVCLSVCPSVQLSLPSVTWRHLANYNDTHVRAAYRTAIRLHKFLFYWVFSGFWSSGAQIPSIEHRNGYLYFRPDFYFRLGFHFRDYGGTSTSLYS